MKEFSMTNRRSFLSLLGGSAVLPFLQYGCSGGAKHSRHLVTTPELRDQYLTSMLDELCTGLGPRPVGSEAFNKGADIVARELSKALPDVEHDTFPMTTWTPADNMEFTVGGESLLAYPAELSPGTGPDGIVGRLRKSRAEGYTYDIIGQSVNALVARVIVKESRDAFTHLVPEWKTGKSGFPVVIIGAGDSDLLARAAEDGTTVRYKSTIHFVSGAPVANIVGTLPGESKDEVLLLAHQDTVYNGEGANDNTGSLITMMMLAHAMSGSVPHHTIRFIATAGHELGFHGAEHYWERRRAEGSRDRIKFVFDFDSVTWGPRTTIMTTDESVRNAFGAIARDKGYSQPPNLLDEDGAVLDNQPFGKTDASCIYVGSDGYDHMQKVHHTPFDTPDTVPHDCVEIAFNLFAEYFRRTEGVAMEDIH